MGLQLLVREDLTIVIRAHYSRQVNQRKLAAAAILKWEAAEEDAG
jgi:hypothetical protein